jgi:S-formylglutathione hydrolase FrmB
MAEKWTRLSAVTCALALFGVLLVAPAAAGTAEVPGDIAAAGISVPSPLCHPRSTPIPSGPARLVSQSTVPGYGGRVLSVVLDSPAMEDQQHVYVLLPRNYDAGGATRYPVLYLLHGAGGSYKDWVDMGVENDIDYTSAADHLGPFITVMPDDGAWGFYTDWYGTDLDSSSTAPPPAWTTYDIDELIPWVDGHFPVDTGRDGRAIAGLSMGGFGSMSYAARYPDLFSVAGSFSGVTDTDIDYPAGGEALNLLSSAFTHGPPNQCIWGDTITQGVLWHAGDPTYLASNLAGMSLFVASGNGQPGVYDKAGSTSTEEDGLIESLVYDMNEGFASALAADNIPFTKYFYGAGTHSWGYWLRDLAHFLPQMAGVFANPPPAAPTAPFDFRTVATNFSTHGFDFSVDHLAEAFTYLTGVGPGGLSVVGTGVLTIQTPSDYTPGGSYEVTTNGAARPERADADGRLTFTVNLGAPVPLQQFDFTGNDPNSFPHAEVVITAG